MDVGGLPNPAVPAFHGPFGDFTIYLVVTPVPPVVLLTGDRLACAVWFGHADSSCCDVSRHGVACFSCGKVYRAAVLVSSRLRTNAPGHIGQ